MKAITHPPNPCRQNSIAAPFRGARAALLAAAILFCFTSTPEGWTQDPVAPPPGAVIGATLGESLRNAAADIQTQAAIVGEAAYDWSRRANSSTYRPENFPQDLANLQLQFQTLRNRFNWLATLVAQLGLPPASNAAAELDAGLNLISELFTLLENQARAGTLEAKTIVRTCRVFADAILEWERELNKNSSRLKLVW